MSVPIIAPEPYAGNLATMTRAILDDLHLLADEPRVWRAICASIRFHFSNRLWFSERPFTLAVRAGKYDYAPGDGFLPSDLVEIVGKRLFLNYQGSDLQSEPLDWLSAEEWDLRRAHDTQTGTPDAWTYDGRRLKLLPTPNNSADVVTGYYVTNIGVPRYRYNTNTALYEFFTPEGRPLTGDYTNDWFQWEVAEQVTRYRAMHELSLGLKDPDNATTWLGKWLEAKTMIEDETDSKVASGMDRLMPRLW